MNVVNEYLLMLAKEDASDNINALIKQGEHFKIGKSGDDPDTTKTRYANDYSGWGIVYKNDESKLIGALEEKLIEQYQKSHLDTCDNEQVGGSQGEDASYIYLAYN